MLKAGAIEDLISGGKVSAAILPIKEGNQAERMIALARSGDEAHAEEFEFYGIRASDRFAGKTDFAEPIWKLKLSLTVRNGRLYPVTTGINAVNIAEFTYQQAVDQGSSVSFNEHKNENVLATVVRSDKTSLGWAINVSFRDKDGKTHSLTLYPLNGELTPEIVRKRDGYERYRKQTPAIGFHISSLQDAVPVSSRHVFAMVMPSLGGFPLRPEVIEQEERARLEAEQIEAPGESADADTEGGEEDGQQAANLAVPETDGDESSRRVELIEEAAADEVSMAAPVVAPPLTELETDEVLVHARFPERVTFQSGTFAFRKSISESILTGKSQTINLKSGDISIAVQLRSVVSLTNDIFARPSVSTVVEVGTVNYTIADKEYSGQITQIPRSPDVYFTDANGKIHKIHLYPGNVLLYNGDCTKPLIDPHLGWERSSKSTIEEMFKEYAHAYAFAGVTSNQGSYNTAIQVSAHESRNEMWSGVHNRNYKNKIYLNIIKQDSGYRIKVVERDGQKVVRLKLEVEEGDSIISVSASRVKTNDELEIDYIMVNEIGVIYILDRKKGIILPVWLADYIVSQRTATLDTRKTREHLDARYVATETGEVKKYRDVRDGIETLVTHNDMPLELADDIAATDKDAYFGLELVTPKAMLNSEGDRRTRRRAARKRRGRSAASRPTPARRTRHEVWPSNISMMPNTNDMRQAMFACIVSRSQKPIILKHDNIEVRINFKVNTRTSSRSHPNVTTRISIIEGEVQYTIGEKQFRGKIISEGPKGNSSYYFVDVDGNKHRIIVGSAFIGIATEGAVESLDESKSELSKAVYDDGILELSGTISGSDDTTLHRYSTAIQSIETIKRNQAWRGVSVTGLNSSVQFKTQLNRGKYSFLQRGKVRNKYIEARIKGGVNALGKVAARYIHTDEELGLEYIVYHELGTVYALHQETGIVIPFSINDRNFDSETSTLKTEETRQILQLRSVLNADGTEVNLSSIYGEAEAGDVVEEADPLPTPMAVDIDQPEDPEEQIPHSDPFTISLERFVPRDVLDEVGSEAVSALIEGMLSFGGIDVVVAQVRLRADVRDLLIEHDIEDDALFEAMIAFCTDDKGVPDNMFFEIVEDYLDMKDEHDIDELYRRFYVEKDDES